MACSTNWFRSSIERDNWNLFWRRKEKRRKWTQRKFGKNIPYRCSTRFSVISWLTVSIVQGSFRTFMSINMFFFATRSDTNPMHSQFFIFSNIQTNRVFLGFGCGWKRPLNYESNTSKFRNPKKLISVFFSCLSRTRQILKECSRVICFYVQLFCFCFFFISARVWRDQRL